MSYELNILFLGSIPIEVKIMENGDTGRPFMDNCNEDKSGPIKAFGEIVDNIIKNTGVRI